MTIPPYDQNVPLVDQSIADSQPPFLQNFSQLFNAFNLNHISLDDPTNPGNHNVIQLVEQADGDSTFSQEISIYSKKVENQTDQLFMRYPNNGKEIQLTQYQIYPIQPTATQQAYFTFLPGGIVVYFGMAICVGTTSFNINLNPTICTNISSINLANINSNPSNAKPQPNVGLIQSGNAFSAVNIKSAIEMVDQYYLIMGNL